MARGMRTHCLWMPVLIRTRAVHRRPELPNTSNMPPILCVGSSNSFPKAATDRLLRRGDGSSKSRPGDSGSSMELGPKGAWAEAGDVAAEDAEETEDEGIETPER